jgi:hypothetical protein
MRATVHFLLLNGRPFGKQVVDQGKERVILTTLEFHLTFRIYSIDLASERRIKGKESGNTDQGGKWNQKPFNSKSD